jgi:hypothetical protein
MSTGSQVRPPAPPRAEPQAAAAPAQARVGSPELARALAEMKGQTQFLLYLADQVEDSLQQLVEESEPGHTAFLGKMLAMYCAQLETKHQGLGEKISETCQEIYITVRDFDTP